MISKYDTLMFQIICTIEVIHGTSARLGSIGIEHLVHTILFFYLPSRGIVARNFITQSFTRLSYINRMISVFLRWTFNTITWRTFWIWHLSGSDLLRTSPVRICWLVICIFREAAFIHLCFLAWQVICVSISHHGVYIHYKKDNSTIIDWYQHAHYFGIILILEKDLANWMMLYY